MTLHRKDTVRDRLDDQVLLLGICFFRLFSMLAAPNTRIFVISDSCRLGCRIPEGRWGSWYAEEELWNQGEAQRASEQMSSSRESMRMSGFARDQNAT